jgi:hypothetical protein
MLTVGRKGGVPAVSGQKETSTVHGPFSEVDDTLTLVGPRREQVSTRQQRKLTRQAHRMQRRFVMLRMTLVFVCAWLAACAETLKPVDGPLATATVVGRVVDPSGEGAAGISVVVEARALNSCANARMDRDSVATDQMGGFEATVSNFGEEFTVCARVRVTPGSMFAADSVERVSVRMHYLTPDTIRVDIALRPSA